jgi:hypothetical protein
VQLLVTRQYDGSAEGWTLAVKGGHNDENHNHNDVGSVIAALDATPVLIDLGQPTYTAISFSDRRYEQWVVRSEWHNVPVVNGRQQEPGPQWRACGFAIGDDAVAELDLSLAYPSGELHRTATLHRSQGAVEVMDTWAAGDEITEHFVIAGRPISHEGGRLVIETLGGALAALTWDAGLGAGLLETRGVDDDLLANVWGPSVHRLIIQVGGDRRAFELTLTRLEESARD